MYPINPTGYAPLPPPQQAPWPGYYPAPAAAPAPPLRCPSCGTVVPVPGSGTVHYVHHYEYSPGQWWRRGGGGGGNRRGRGGKARGRGRGNKSNQSNKSVAAPADGEGAAPTKEK